MFHLLNASAGIYEQICSTAIEQEGRPSLVTPESSRDKPSAKCTQEFPSDPHLLRLCRLGISLDQTDPIVDRNYLDLGNNSVCEGRFSLSECRDLWIVQLPEI